MGGFWCFSQSPFFLLSPLQVQLVHSYPPKRWTLIGKLMIIPWKFSCTRNYLVNHQHNSWFLPFQIQTPWSKCDGILVAISTSSEFKWSLSSRKGIFQDCSQIQGEYIGIFKIGFLIEFLLLFYFTLSKIGDLFVDLLLVKLIIIYFLKIKNTMT